MLPYLQYINVIAYFSVKYSLTKFSNIAGILLKFMTFTCTCHEKESFHIIIAIMLALLPIYS